MNKKETLTTVTLVILYTGFIFAGFSWMLSSKISPLEKRVDRMEERIGLEMQEIKSMLGQLIAQNTHHKGKSVGKFKKPSKAKPIPRKTASQ